MGCTTGRLLGRRHGVPCTTQKARTQWTGRPKAPEGAVQSDAWPRLDRDESSLPCTVIVEHRGRDPKSQVHRSNTGHNNLILQAFTRRRRLLDLLLLLGQNHVLVAPTLYPTWKASRA